MTTIQGPITAADLDTCANAGRIYYLHGTDGEMGAAMLMPAEACTEVGHTEPERRSLIRAIADEVLALWWVWIGFGIVSGFAGLASLAA